MTAEKQNKELHSMKEILQDAIKREQSAHEFYLRAREQARTPAEEEMFARLAAEEMHHKEALQQQLQEIDAQMDMDRALSFDVY